MRDFEDGDYARLKKLITALEAGSQGRRQLRRRPTDDFRPAPGRYAFGNIRVWLRYFKDKKDLEIYSGLPQCWLWLNGIDLPEGSLSSDLRKRSRGKPRSDKAYRWWLLQQQGMKIEQIAHVVVHEQVKTDIAHAVREVYRFLAVFKNSPEGRLLELCRLMLEIPEDDDEEISALCREAWIAGDDDPREEDDPG